MYQWTRRRQWKSLLVNYYKFNCRLLDVFQNTFHADQVDKVIRTHLGALTNQYDHDSVIHVIRARGSEGVVGHLLLVLLQRHLAADLRLNSALLGPPDRILELTKGLWR